MLKPWVVAAAVVLAVGVTAAFTTRPLPARDAEYKQHISILQAQLAEAQTDRKADSVEVVRTVIKTRTLRDTLLQNLTDTVKVKEYVYQTDTLRIACLRCMASAARVGVVTDSLNHTWQLRFDAVKPSRWDKIKPYVFGGVGFLLGASSH